MYLQLAEKGSGLSDRFKPKSIRYTPKSVRYGKERGGSTNITAGGAKNWAGSIYGSGASPALTFMSEPENPFIYVPDPTGLTGGMYVREDHFDNLNDQEWRQMMANLAPYQPTVENGVLSQNQFMADRASRKERREERREQRSEKKEAKTDLKKARAESKVIKAEAKKIKAESGEKPGADILGKVLDVGGKIAGGIFGAETAIPGGGGSDEERKQDPDYDASGKKKKKPFYKNPYVIGGGVLLLLAGGYALSKRKKK